MARSLTVPLTARSPIVPPGKNSGCTTNESVEKASRTPADVDDGGVAQPRSAAAPNAGRNRCSISSPDIAPPPPCPITMVGLSRSGTGQTQEPKSNADGRPPLGVHRRFAHDVSLGVQLQPPVQVVGGAGALGGDHRGAERVARRALLAERGALVRLDQPLQHLAGPADRPTRRCGCRAPSKRCSASKSRYCGGQSPAAVRDDADTPPGAVGDLEDVLQHGLRRQVALGRNRALVGVLQLVAAGSSSWMTVRRMPSRMSSGSNPVTTIGTSYFSRQRRVLARCP